MVESIGNPAGIGQGTGLGLRERDRDGIGLGNYRLRTKCNSTVSVDYIEEIIFMLSRHNFSFRNKVHHISWPVSWVMRGLEDISRG